MSREPLAEKAEDGSRLTAHGRFEQLHADTRDSLIDLAFRWAEGELSATTFGEQVDSLLRDAHTEAVVIGRHHAGDTAPREADDELFAMRIVQEESGYLQSFVDDLQAGHYTDDAGVRDAERVAARASLYGGRLTGSANQAWTLALDEDTEITWHLGGEDHCPDCPPIAEGSPYLPAELDAYPGSNSTRCLQNCACWLTTQSGSRGFTTP